MYIKKFLLSLATKILSIKFIQRMQLLSTLKRKGKKIKKDISGHILVIKRIRNLTKKAVVPQTNKNAFIENLDNRMLTLSEKLDD